MLIDLLRTRRSIRRFTAAQVESAKVELLVEAALRAPSSRGRNPWDVTVVTDPALIERLAATRPHGSQLLHGAPLALIVAGDPAASDVWIEDAVIVMTLLHLEAHDLGLGSCWIQVRRRTHDAQLSASAYIAEVAGLRDGLEVEAMLAVGYAAEEKPGRDVTSLPWEKVHRGGLS